MAGHGPFSFVPGPRKAGRESIVPTNLSSLSLPLSLSATMPCIVSLLFLAEYIAASNPNGGTR